MHRPHRNAEPDDPAHQREHEALGQRLAEEPAARCADGWEASYVSPERSAALTARFDARLAGANRAARQVRRSVEVDVALVDSDTEAAACRARFCAERGLAAGDPLLHSALIGDRETIAIRIAEYEAAGATDLMLGFADFPATTMLERLARALG